MSRVLRSAWARVAVAGMALAMVLAAVPTIAFSATGTVTDAVAFDGSVSGSVTAGGVGVEGITVAIRPSYTSMPIASTTTGPTGAFRFDGLETGAYMVSFNPAVYNEAHGTSYLVEYYQNTHDYYAATPITVSQGVETTGINATLDSGGRIAGSVTLGGTAGYVIMVDVLDGVTGFQVWHGTTATDGTYLSGSLPPGQYKVQFTGGLWSIGPYLGEYYRDAHTAAAATLVSVSAGVTTPGIDASLDLDTRLHGWVFGDGIELSGVRVEALRADTHALVGSVTSGADGEFTFYGLPAGTYILRFDPTDYNAVNGTSFESEYCGETHDAAEAEIITVQVRVTGEDVGVDLTSPQTGLRGTVTNLAGAPIEGIEVWLKDPDTDDLVDYTYTDAAGGYSFTDLPAGSYLVEYVPYELNQLSDELIVGEWYNDAIRRENADQVTLIHGQTTPGINAALTVLMPVYRFYNFNTGTHFYTPSYDEAIMVIDELSETFDFEGIAYYTNPANNGQPLYRFYNRKTGSHFYTADSAEAANIMATLAHTYSYDGQTYAVNQAPVPNSIPVYRFYNVKKGSHFYTADWYERDTVIATLGSIYRYEGPCFYLGQ